MATIRTSIQMQDNMSGPLRSMSAALGNVINMMESMQRAGNTAINPANIQAARSSLAQVASAASSVSSELREAASAQGRLNNEIRDGDGAMGGLVGSVMGLVGAYSLINGLQAATSISDTVSNTTARLNMVNDGLQTTAELQEMIFASAERSRASYQSTADLVAQLGLRAPEAFTDNKQALVFGENLSKMFAIAGASVQEMDSATLQLTQALGSGVLRGEEFNAVFEAAPNVIQSIAKYMGVTIGEMRSLAEDGALSADIVKRAMLESTEEISKQFAMMPKTFEQNMTSLKNYALFAFNEVWEAMSRVANSKGMENFTNGLIQGIGTLSYVAVNALNLISSVGGFLQSQWWYLGPIIGTVATAVIVATSAFLLIQGATLAWAAAQAVLNSAMWANPLTWVVATVIALIGVIYLVVGAINHFAGTSISATGIVLGAFAVLFAYIYNTISFLYNLFATFAEFIANVFINPVYSVKALFVNLAKIAISMAESMIGSFDSAATNLGNVFISGANMAIKAINWVIDAMNAIPGIDIGNVSELSARTSVSADLSGLKTNLSNWLGDAPASYKSVAKMGTKSLPDAFMNTYNGVKSATMGKTPGLDTSLDALLSEIADSAGEGAKDGKDTKKNTKKLADKAGILVDDLKYLRDLSEREAINRYTTASIQVDMKNDLNVNSSLDVDGIIDRFGEKMEETAEIISAGGVLNV
jgi:tape measure domain-containing protein